MTPNGPVWPWMVRNSSKWPCMPLNDISGYRICPDTGYSRIPDISAHQICPDTGYQIIPDIWYFRIPDISGYWIFPDTGYVQILAIPGYRIFPHTDRIPDNSGYRIFPDAYYFRIPDIYIAQKNRLKISISYISRYSWGNILFKLHLKFLYEYTKKNSRYKYDYNLFYTFQQHIPLNFTVVYFSTITCYYINTMVYGIYYSALKIRKKVVE